MENLAPIESEPVLSAPKATSSSAQMLLVSLEDYLAAGGESHGLFGTATKLAIRPSGTKP